MKPKFIIFEGLDLSGKSTIIKEMKKKENNYKYTREPGGFDLKLCDKIRDLILDYPEKINAITEAYLFAASRAEHSIKIKEMLSEGSTVITDRYLYSSIYCQGIMKHLGVDVVKDINKYAVLGLKADLIFYFTTSEEERKRRAGQRAVLNNLDKQSIDEDFKKANKDYYEVIKNNTKARIYIVDTSVEDESIIADMIIKIINNEEV